MALRLPQRRYCAWSLTLSDAFRDLLKWIADATAETLQLMRVHSDCLEKPSQRYRPPAEAVLYH